MIYIVPILKHTIYADKPFNNSYQLRMSIVRQTNKKAVLTNFIRSDYKLVIAISENLQKVNSWEDKTVYNKNTDEITYEHICQLSETHISRVVFNDTLSKYSLEISARTVSLFDDTDEIHKGSCIYQCNIDEFNEEEFFNISLFCEFLINFNDVKIICNDVIKNLHKHNIRVLYKISVD